MRLTISVRTAHRNRRVFCETNRNSDGQSMKEFFEIEVSDGENYVASLLSYQTYRRYSFPTPQAAPGMPAEYRCARRKFGCNFGGTRTSPSTSCGTSHRCPRLMTNEFSVRRQKR